MSCYLRSPFFCEKSDRSVLGSIACNRCKRSRALMFSNAETSNQQSFQIRASTLITRSPCTVRGSRSCGNGRPSVSFVTADAIVTARACVRLAVQQVRSDRCRQNFGGSVRVAAHTRSFCLPAMDAVDRQSLSIESERPHTLVANTGWLLASFI